MTWRPIETAPKDGTRVLLTVRADMVARYGHEMVCAWDEGNAGEWPEDEYGRLGWYNEPSETWYAEKLFDAWAPLNGSRWHRMDDPDNPPPKDGTVVLVYVPRFGKGFGDVTTAWYCAETGLWPHDEPHTEEGEPCNVGLPTYWQPLPEPPEDSA